ncbi:MAG TPA: FtsQ-type POTRA domain-containing protein [Acidobacteriaceae bacterium]|nr:FtsQ-type POTRA domain-containing protein [Acidobacteriaceae bacterium]
MAKTNASSGGATLLDEPADFYRPTGSRDSDTRSSRPVRAKADPDDDAEEPFLRARRRVPVRHGLLPAWTRSGWGKLALVGGLLAGTGMAIALILGARSFLDHDPRFRIDSSASIQTLGNSQLSRGDLLSVFGSDIGRNLFFVPLTKRRMELEQIPWVQRATVMRLMPNQLRVAIVERKPIAFVQQHGRVELADIDGVILSMTPQQMAARHYSFPVVSGINPGDPLSVRGARMQMYQRFIGELDSTGEHLSAQLSEVDLSDPEDVRATVPANGTDLLLHFGQEDFMPRWRNYQAHVAQWQQQYPHLAAIDLRYEHEVVLKMAGDPGTNAGGSPEGKPAPAPVAAKPAVSAKPAPTAAKPAPKPVAVQPPVAGKPAAKAVGVTPHSIHRTTVQHRVKSHKPQPAKHSQAGKTHAAHDKTAAKRGTA